MPGERGHADAAKEAVDGLFSDPPGRNVEILPFPVPGVWVGSTLNSRRRIILRRQLGLGLGCAGCCFEIGEATFCEVGGAYPAQREK